MRREKLYLDTSVISAYSDYREAEKQEQTQEFFKRYQDNEFFISALVLKELSGIRNEARLETTKKLLENFLELSFSDEVAFLAEKYVSLGIIPATHEEDALHVAYAVVNDMDCIISWNFKHLVKRNTRRKVNAVNEFNGFSTIEIIAPIEF